MANNNKIDQSKVGDWPTLTEQDWYVVAISLVIIGIVLGGFGLLWVFAAPEITETKDRMSLITPIVTVYLALVTFCTVAWRGMVNSRQADQQKRQNDAKDEENLAKLLLDGTKLVSDKGANTAEVHAGIAALNVVSSSSVDTFAVHVMDILTLVIERTYNDPTQEYVYAAARDALNAAAKKGRVSGRKVELLSTADEDLTWDAINGCRRILYSGGTFIQREFEALLKQQTVFFRGVTFDECHLGNNFTFLKGCSFEMCTFEQVKRGDLMRCRYDSCDFSGAAFKLGSASPSVRKKYLEKLRDGQSVYVKGNPPTGVTEEELRDYFRQMDDAP